MNWPRRPARSGRSAKRSSTCARLVGRLERAAKDKDIAGVVLDIHNPAIGRAKIDELRAAISRFRASGKKVYAQIEPACRPTTWSPARATKS